MSETLGFLLQTAVVTRALFIMPFEGKRKWRLLIAAGSDEAARRRFFLRFIMTWWAVAAVVCASLWLTKEPPAALRLKAIDGADSWAGLLVCLALTAVPGARAWWSRPFRDRVRQAFAAVQPLLPRTRQERWLFAAVAVTAGCCEELVFRGLVPAYFAKLLPGVEWAGPAISIIAFGMAHGYQGPRNVLLTAVLGAAFYAIMWVSGSVYAAMALHAANDLRALALSVAIARRD